MRTVLAAVLLILSAPPTLAAGPASLEAALAEARERRAAVIVDFHAPWCYSCYYMASHVLNGPEWAAVQKRAVVLEQDADAPEGAALKERLGVKALPSYVVLDAEGAELGRILGEQTRADFYAALDALLDQGSALDALAGRVRGRDAASLAAARSVLGSYHARFDASGGLAWYAALPAAAREAIAGDDAGALWLARLRFLDAAQREALPECLATGDLVLRGALGCARAYEMARYLGCAAQAPDARPRLAAQRASMEALVASGAFGASRCADQRSVVLVTADLHAALEDRAAEQALLRRAIADLQPRIGGRLAADRNLADNLRVYHDRLATLTGDYAALDALMLELVAAWPEDYVYAFRHGRSLLARGQPAAALPFLEQAAPHAYGINRLKLAEQRVQALQALGRGADARRVVAEALKANGPWFPEDAARLKALLRS